MSYLDFSNAELFALTRQRRAEGHRRREIRVYPPGDAGRSKSKDARSAWRILEWTGGNRACFYCKVETVLDQQKSTEFCTVDHRIPRAKGGPDDPSNYVICCALCNDLKGALSEELFRVAVLPGILRRRAAELTAGAVEAILLASTP